MAQPPLTVDHERSPTQHTVRVVGEIDLATIPILAGALTAVGAEVIPPTAVVANLSGVSFCSSAGLRLLVTTHERCHARGTPFRVVTANSAVLRAMAVTGADETLTVVRG